MTVQTRDAERGLVQLRIAGGQLVCERCKLAATPVARMKGLLGRPTLPAGEGLLLEPAGSIHTFFMRFPIDAVFLDGDRRVSKVVSNMQPWHAAASKGSTAVLELAAGEAGTRGVKPGDLLEEVAQ